MNLCVCNVRALSFLTSFTASLGISDILQIFPAAVSNQTIYSVCCWFQCMSVLSTAMGCCRLRRCNYRHQWCLNCCLFCVLWRIDFFWAFEKAFCHPWEQTRTNKSLFGKLMCDRTGATGMFVLFYADFFLFQTLGHVTLQRSELS